MILMLSVHPTWVRLRDEMKVNVFMSHIHMQHFHYLTASHLYLYQFTVHEHAKPTAGYAVHRVYGNNYMQEMHFSITSNQQIIYEKKCCTVSDECIYKTAALLTFHQ